MEVIELKSGTIREANLEDRGATAHYQSRALDNVSPQVKAVELSAILWFQKRASRKLLSGSGLPTPFVLEPAGPVRGDAHPERAKA
jgi:hypothetical protein